MSTTEISAYREVLMPRRILVPCQGVRLEVFLMPLCGVSMFRTWALIVWMQIRLILDALN